MRDFKLLINVNEANLILKALGNMPYNQINELIAKMHSQIQEQLLETNEERITEKKS